MSADAALPAGFDRRNASYEQIRADFWPVMAPYADLEGAILPILHEAQRRYGWVSETTVRVIAEFLRTTPPSVYAVLTYYHELMTTPPADVHVLVCAGPACRVAGGPRLQAEVEESTGITVGDTRRDLAYSIGSSACLGICMHPPVAAINLAVRGNLRPGQVNRMLREALARVRQGEGGHG